MQYKNISANDGLSISNMFSDFFYSTFLAPNSNSALRTTQSNQYNQTFTSMAIKIEDVSKLLSGLDTSKSAGPDKLPPIFLKNCYKSICVPVYLLFVKSLSECHVPSLWKSAYITPIHKKGSKSDVSNYRPVFKLCILAKLLEKIILTCRIKTLKPLITIRVSTRVYIRKIHYIESCLI
jgi:hypothetical protein